ncbi:MAG TPA: hypothetical protein VHC71_06595, partial [Hyphomicrobium sp.]|nr:hypothetical protein [Hyphomicrobium sp.]
MLRDRGPARYPQAAIPESSTTVINRANRTGHAAGLRTGSSNVLASWQVRQAERIRSGLPPITGGIPLLLRIDTTLDLDDLRRQFKFEIVSEQEGGFVIVASEDVNLAEFRQKLTDFIGSVTGSGNVAKIHELREDLTQEERLRLILTDTLFAEWPGIQDDSQYICDVSVTCIGDWEIPNKPSRN